MLAKPNRLRGQKTFKGIFRNGSNFNSQNLVLRILSNGLALPRVGFIVSSKVAKKAVVRNQIRRRLSEAVKARLGKIKPGVDLVFIAKSGLVKKNFNETAQEVDFLLKKANLYA